MCGKQLDRHTTSGRCRKCAARGEQNPFYGQRHSEESKQRMKAAWHRRDRATSYGRHKLSSLSYQNGRLRYWSKLSPDQRSIRLVTFIEAGLRCNRRSSRTKVENVVAEILDKLGVSYIRNAQIARYNVDFLIIDNMIIECYGDYWHCNPRIYPADYHHPILQMTAAEKWRRDRERLDLLIDAGFTCHVIWEHDIDHNRSEVQATLTTIFAPRMEDGHAMD
jgi:G:T-mismatch repair DNA endonuclease (very short patch repair protein)